MAVFQKTLDTKKSTCLYSYRFRRKDGSYADIEDRVFILRDASGIGVRALGAMTDITERVQLEEKVRKNHNLEMLGILAAGIAHDFNNMLTGIIASFSLLEMLTDSNSEAHTIAREGNELLGLQHATHRYQQQRAPQQHPLRKNAKRRRRGLPPWIR